MKNNLVCTVICGLFLLLFSASAEALLTPADLRAVADSPNQVSLTWVDLNPPNAGVYGYSIERSVNSAGAFAVVGTTKKNMLMFTDSGLEAATLYYYRIRTIGKKGTLSAYSAPPAAVTTLGTDGTPPLVFITNPAADAIYTTSQNVTIAAFASDNTGVARTELYDNGIMMGASPNSYCAYERAFTSLDNGIHVLTAKAYDAAGNIAISAARSVAVEIAAIPAAMRTDAVWSAGGAESYANDIVFDGTYLYAAFNTVPSSVTKIDSATMNTVNAWTGRTDDIMAENIAFDGQYLYVSTQNAPARVIKLDPGTMTEVGRWTGQSGEDWASLMVSDGNYVYVELYTHPAKVIKIEPSTMTTAGTWTGREGENTGVGLAFDGTFLYVGLYVSPAKIIKIDPLTMTAEGSWAGSSGENLSRHLTFDGNFLYISLETSPVQVVKIDPGMMSTIGKWIGEAGQNIGYSMTHDGTYLYAGLETDPAQIVRLETDSMTPMTMYVADPGNRNASSLITDGEYLYATLYMSPAKVLKISLGR